MITIYIERERVREIKRGRERDTYYEVRTNKTATTPKNLQALNTMFSTCSNIEHSEYTDDK